MIVVQDLVKEYREEDVVTPALRGLSFTIEQGEFVSIMGPSGSGKSTILHILSFLDRPSSGTYAFSGKSMSDLTDEDLAHIRNQDMGFIFQGFNLMSRSTVYENVELPLLYHDGIARRERRSKITAAIDAVGLSEKLSSEAGRLSGGQKQRVAIARALVNDPNVIFADEPTGNLDSVSGAQVMTILEGLNKTGRTIILVTHETYTAEFANRLIRLKDGLIESDEPVAMRRERQDQFFK